MNPTPSRQAWGNLKVSVYNNCMGEPDYFEQVRAKRLAQSEMQAALAPHLRQAAAKIRPLTPAERREAREAEFVVQAVFPSVLALIFFFIDPITLWVSIPVLSLFIIGMLCGISLDRGKRKKVSVYDKGMEKKHG